MEHDFIILMIYGIKEKSIILIATNIPQWLMTAFVFQGHIHIYIYFFFKFTF